MGLLNLVIQHCLTVWIEIWTKTASGIVVRSIPYLHPSVAVSRMALTPVELAEAMLIALHYWANDSESAHQASFKQKAFSANAIKTWTSDDGGVGYENDMIYNPSLLFFVLIEPHCMGSNVPSVSHIVFPKWT